MADSDITNEDKDFEVSPDVTLENSLVGTLELLLKVGCDSSVRDDVKRVIETLRALDYYSALLPTLSAPKDFEFVKKHGKHQLLKVPIAEFLKQELKLPDRLFSPKGGRLKRNGFFLGAGTTVAEFSRLMCQELRKKRSQAPTLPIVTNNVIIADALSCHMPLAKLVSGYPCRQYRATLPPLGESSRLQGEEREVFFRRYAEDFQHLASQVGRCSDVLIGCSRFSFIFGPLVKSVENALAKRAVFHGATLGGKSDYATVRILLTPSKIIPITSQGTREFEKLLAPVFQFSKQRLEECLEPLQKKQKNIVRPEVPPREWTWHQLACRKKPGNLKLFRSDIAEIANGAVGGSFTPDYAWWDFGCPIQILVGLSADSKIATTAIKVIEEEIQVANEIFKASKKVGRPHPLYSMERHAKVVCISISFPAD